jgi:hypothetical protein
MTNLQKPPQRGDRHARKAWHTFGHADEAVRHTDACEHENFAEEQARWERSDPEYARICEEVRKAKHRGEEASRRADVAKAEWDARVAPQRQANDDAQRAHHALRAAQTTRSQTLSSREASSPPTQATPPIEGSDATRGDPRSGRSHLHTTFAIESNDSPAPGIIPEPVRVHDQPAVPTRRAGGPPAGRASKLLSSPGRRIPVRILLAKLMSVIRGDKYMIDAYLPAWSSDPDTRDNDGPGRPNHHGALRATVQPAARREPRQAKPGTPTEPQRRSADS